MRTVDSIFAGTNHVRQVQLNEPCRLNDEKMTTECMRAMNGSCLTLVSYHVCFSVEIIAWPYTRAISSTNWKPIEQNESWLRSMQCVLALVLKALCWIWRCSMSPIVIIVERIRIQYKLSCAIIGAYKVVCARYVLPKFKIKSEGVANVRIWFRCLFSFARAYWYTKKNSRLDQWCSVDHKFPCVRSNLVRQFSMRVFSVSLLFV